MNTVLFLDVVTLVTFAICAYLIFFTCYLHHKDKQREDYILYLEQENDELDCEISCLRQELNNADRKFKATVNFLGR